MNDDPTTKPDAREAQESASLSVEPSADGPQAAETDRARRRAAAPAGPVDVALLKAAVWAPSGPLSAGDYDLNPGARAARRTLPLRRAAVLCAAAPREDGLHVILTRRADHLRRHAGQIAFPGGKIDAGDPSPMAAALREAEEEIGLVRDQVDVIGAIEPYETGTGFHVTPFIGLADPAFQPITDDAEVAEVFEAPLDFLMDPRNRQNRSYDLNGKRRRFYAYVWEGRTIWGATAGMLSCLAERVALAREELLRAGLERAG